MRLCSKSSQPTRSLHRILGCPASHSHRTPVPHLTTTAFDFDLVNLDRPPPAFCQSPSVPRPFIPCAWLYSNPRTAINPGVRTSHLLDLRYILAGPDPVSPAQNRYLTSGPGRPGRPVTFANHPPGPGFGVTTFSSSSQTPRRLLCPLASQPANPPGKVLYGGAGWIRSALRMPSTLSTTTTTANRHPPPTDTTASSVFHESVRKPPTASTASLCPRLPAHGPQALPFSHHPEHYRLPSVVSPSQSASPPTARLTGIPQSNRPTLMVQECTPYRLYPFPLYLPPIDSTDTTTAASSWF
ncbi:hypothetical protein CCHR01_19550 [Colletotrichum chrysophilum]|uniref:Uncharacterized protein n=1 Tax=Colletotrichum chrysophilum TaxID=1836956 RepID=A0AAD9E7R9_9PEZI|nr:hypothetical protein CCHR01_19550 [Colletotrichum chrysophilum]